MRDPDRIERIVELLRKTWLKQPDSRLTQLVINASGTHHDCGPVFCMEDDEFEKRLKRFADGFDSKKIMLGRGDPI